MIKARVEKMKFLGKVKPVFGVRLSGGVDYFLTFQQAEALGNSIIKAAIEARQKTWEARVIPFSKGKS